MDKLYAVFGLTENATDEELKAKYEELKAQYSEERFQEGEKGNIAAKKLTELENAYREINAQRQESKSDYGDKYAQIEEKIKSGDLQSAQYILDSFDERDAKWHYYQSVVYYKKSWYNESKKQLEIACEMDKGEEKYKKELEKLNEQMNKSSETVENQGWNKSGNTEQREQMGGNGCMEACCQVIACNACLNCFCNSCR